LPSGELRSAAVVLLHVVGLPEALGEARQLEVRRAAFFERQAVTRLASLK
jgi:hypothetical protein